MKAIQYIMKQLRCKNYEPFVFLRKSITQAVTIVDIVGFLLFIGTVAINLRLFFGLKLLVKDSKFGLLFKTLIPTIG